MEILTTYILPIVFFLALGILAGIILTLASRALAVKTDETVEKLLEALPGINCGACGFSGCEGYAVALAKGDTKANLCKPGGNLVASNLGEILGVNVGVLEKEVAYVHCNGNSSATERKYEYRGYTSCKGAARFYNGTGKCPSMCEGYGDCVGVCDYDAIEIVNNLAVVNKDKCTACGLCIQTCPKNIISLRPYKQEVIVTCSSNETGKKTRESCKNGCIACRLCVKKCPEGAIEVKDNLAHIDPNKCTACGICIDVCPTKCIHRTDEKVCFNVKEIS